MNLILKQYLQDSSRTCPDLGIYIDLSHMVLGINTEIVELREAIENKDIVNIGEEVADCMWYLMNYIRKRRIDLPQTLNDRKASTAFLYDTVSLLQDIVKKHIAYNKPIDEAVEKDLINKIYTVLINICDTYNIAMEEILKRNIAKLKQRYPEKFTMENAINRDLEKERKILEGDENI